MLVMIHGEVLIYIFHHYDFHFEVENFVSTAYFLRVNGRKTDVLGTLYMLYNRVKFCQYHIIFD
jgi:hypothetical protein